MQIASSMAGFSLGEADLLRRAVSKKKREVLDEQRAHFVAGALRQGYAEAEAHHVYDMIVRFADYGFPRAHATAYGVLAFQTAYLKAHYPMPFMASMLTAVMGNHRKTAEYVDECRRMGLAVLPPDVGASGTAFTPAPAPASPEEPGPGADAAGEAGAAVRGAIRFGLAAVKNVGTHAIDAILQERQNKPFASLLDFCRRVDLRVCNKRVIESLIQSGAMDSLPGNRAQKMAVLDKTIEAALKWRKDHDELQLSLQGFEEVTHWEIEYPDLQEIAPAHRLEWERELLGMYISGHPLDAYRELLDGLEIDQLHHLQEYPDNAEVTVAGMVVASKTIVTKKGQPMAFMELEDRIEKVEVVLFPEVWKQSAPLVQKGNLLLLKAKLQLQDEGVKLLADRVFALNDPQLKERLNGPRPFAETKAPSSSGQRAFRSGLPSRTNEERVSAAAPAKAAAARNGRSGRPAQSVKQQRVYVKISADHEQPSLLSRLQSLLQQHSGPLPVVLFYEKTQRLLVLNEQYKVKPSPELIRAIEAIMGKDSAKVK
jgi:DNA polymerase-3 subunit alpha